MLLDDFSYIMIPPMSGDLPADIEIFYLSNHRQHTYLHVRNVGEEIGKIADKFQLDKDACVLAAHFHDIAIVIKPDDMLSYTRHNSMQIFSAEERYPFILHQRFSSIIAGEYFGITDKRILSAVEHHTTLLANPSPYDMALFIADKLAWDQEGIPPFTRIVREALEKSLYHASLAYIEFVMKNDMILYPHPWLEEAYRWVQELGTRIL